MQQSISENLVIDDVDLQKVSIDFSVIFLNHISDVWQVSFATSVETTTWKYATKSVLGSSSSSCQTDDNLN